MASPPEHCDTPRALAEMGLKILSYQHTVQHGMSGHCFLLHHSDAPGEWQSYWEGPGLTHPEALGYLIEQMQSKPQPDSSQA